MKDSTIDRQRAEQAEREADELRSSETLRRLGRARVRETCPTCKRILRGLRDRAK